MGMTTDEYRLKSQRFRDANPEKSREYVRKWRTANLEEARAGERERKRKKRAEDPAKANAANQAWRDANRETFNQKQRERYAHDPDFRENRLARVRSRQWNITPNQHEAFLRMYEEECFYCGERGGSVDHLVPRSVGGSDDLSNLVTCCQDCNSKKYTSSVETFYQRCPLVI